MTEHFEIFTAKHQTKTSLVSRKSDKIQLGLKVLIRRKIVVISSRDLLYVSIELFNQRSIGLTEHGILSTSRSG